MVKYKVFHGNVESTYEGRQLEERVNDFLDSRTILDVSTNFKSNKIETWWTAGSCTILSYVIKYEGE